MGNIVISFSNFVKESRVYYDETPNLYPQYKEELDDFAIENEILHLISDIEQTWINMKNKYWWNRERSWYRNDHFAIDAKVYIFPDQDKIKEILGKEINDEEYGRLWYTWLEDQREALVDDIDFSWVKDVSWGGKSGGWLLVAPNSTENDAQEQIEELINLYLEEKNNLKNSDSWAEYKQYLEDQDYEYMVKMGMVDEPNQLIQGLKESAKTAIDVLTETRQDMETMISGLDEIIKKINNFKQKGEKWFYDYLEQEKEFDSTVVSQDQTSS